MALKLRKRTPNPETLNLRTDATAIYIRVSTDRQATEGYSLDAQERKLRSLCDANDWRLRDEHVYIDAGESGKTTDRPAFQRMMAAARAGDVRRIVAVRLDRVARNTLAFLELVNELSVIGVDLVLLVENFDASTPSGKFALNMFAALAELERSTIAERMMNGKSERITKGGFNGSPVPYGYKSNKGGKAVQDDVQAAIVRRIFSEFVAGSTMSDIARRLTSEKVPTKHNNADGTVRAWSTEVVRYILRNGTYAGFAQWGDVDDRTQSGTYDAIISAETYEAAVRRLKALKPGKPGRS